MPSVSHNKHTRQIRRVISVLDSGGNLREHEISARACGTEAESRSRSFPFSDHVNRASARDRIETAPGGGACAELALVTHDECRSVRPRRPSDALSDALRLER